MNINLVNNNLTNNNLTKLNSRENAPSFKAKLTPISYSELFDGLNDIYPDYYKEFFEKDMKKHLVEFRDIRFHGYEPTIRVIKTTRKNFLNTIKKFFGKKEDCKDTVFEVTSYNKKGNYIGYSNFNVIENGERAYDSETIIKRFINAAKKSCEKPFNTTGGIDNVDIDSISNAILTTKPIGKNK